MAQPTPVAEDPAYTQTRTVDVGHGQHAHVAFSTSTNTVWALNGADGAATLLDASTGEPAGTVDLGGSPTHIIIDDKLGQAFVPVSQDELLVCPWPTTP